jgi:hypothetical protein
MADILIVYDLVQWPPLVTLTDSLYAFERHTEARCWYLNIGIRRVPWWLSRVEFDAVIFHNTFLWDRVDPRLLARHLRRLSRIGGVGRHRVALPQDEHLCSRALVALIEQLGIDHVFSVAPESEWDTLYDGLDRDRTSISRVLTGYLSPATLERIEEIVRAQGERERRIAVGYRAARLPPALGSHGLLKTEIAERVAPAAAARGLPVDIATGAAATIRGDDWYRFLADCKYTLGVEGGASVHDPEGELLQATVRYLAGHPGATFEQVEAECFPGADGEIAYFAISPRHLEACATRTAQVLIEGSYNGILRPGEHYIELRRDFSNLDDVLDLVQSDHERVRLTDAAYRDVVASGDYTYERFVREVEQIALAGAPHRTRSRRIDMLHAWAKVIDQAAWLKVALWVNVAGRLRTLALRVLPEPVLAFIRRRFAGTAAGTAALQSAD